MARELFADAIDRNPQFETVARVGSIAEILNCLETERVDVALIDATLRDGPLSGIGVLGRQVHEVSPEVRASNPP